MKSVYFVFILLLFYACKNNTSEQHSADYYYNRGVLDYYKGDYKDALDNYNKAIALDSTISSYYSNRGVVREILLNDTLGALYDYKKAIQLNDQNSLAYYNVGCLLSDQGQDKEAIEFYKTCIEIKPNYYSAYYNCAYSQFQIKDYDEALNNFKKYLQYNEDMKLYTYYYMGLIYKATGELEKAKECLEKAKALGNNDAEEELKTIFEQ